MKLAIITCHKLPTGVKDDESLLNALMEIGFDVKVVAWDMGLDWSEFSAGLIRSVWDYHERSDEFTSWLDHVSKEITIINAAEIINWNKNKIYLAELEEFGISIAPTIWLNKDKVFNLTDELSQIPAKKYFLKPVIGADSSGTLPFENNEKGILKAEHHLNKWLPKFTMMIQPYLYSVESFGETSLIYFGGNYSHAVRKIPINGDYRVQDTFGAEDIPYTPNALELSLSKACLQFLEEKFKFICYARFDFLHDSDGAAYLNEAELIEPSLFFNHSPIAAKLLAKEIKKLLNEL